MIAHRIPVAYEGPPVLGVGAYLKNTVALVRTGEALVSHDLGALDTRDGLGRFERAFEALGPEVSAIAHDLHPDFPNTRRALSEGKETVGIQHHHAHVCAVMAEHDLAGPVLGLALDGFGLGADGGSWGGELLRVDARGFERVGHLSPLPLPGGDKAAREPWRMAAAVLHRLGRTDEIPARFPDVPNARALARLLGETVPRETSSAGRLFDAAAGLLGLHPVAEFEGQAAMALEALAETPRVLEGGWAIAEDGGLDLAPLLSRLAEPGLDAEKGANLFHGTLIAALTDWVGCAGGPFTVALSGGCFFNRVLRDGLTDALGKRGFLVLFPERLGPGDPSVSLGQAWAVALSRKEG